MSYLKPGVLPEVSRLVEQGDSIAALKELAASLKEKASQRYYFNWKDFLSRFKQYGEKYPDQRREHYTLTNEQMSTYSPETHWILPFKNQKGKDVTPYQLRHLARQQKSLDMALTFYYEGENPIYLDYFIRQVADLDRAFAKGQYDDAGNGVYEYFRAGKRIHNWLFCHNAYLASEKYDWKKQILLIKTFLHHAAQLRARTKKMSYGNHHTKGLVALFEIATQFPEFSDSDGWIQQALNGLEWHITHEINSDGFQFERSVHYHMGDIENYARVYQLASRNHIKLPPVFIQRFKKMFDAMVELAQPNRRLPVLQDDTDTPYQENNDISGVMTLGTLLFSDSTYRYFADNAIPPDIYWLLQDNQLGLLANVRPAIPQIGSVALPETGYYVMRGGWQLGDLYLVISAGLSKQKPDHQHGDMLGVVAYANGHEILPNYQVKYNFPDYSFWKNSWVKNVALTDSIPLGRKWTPNKGGSGFGKWSILPEPAVELWKTTKAVDYFRGSHNGYDLEGVKYWREVIFVKDSFWIVRDHFLAKQNHTFQQIWQGHYESEYRGRIYTRFSDGSGLRILQLEDAPYELSIEKYRKKASTVFSLNDSSSFTFSTVLIPQSMLAPEAAADRRNELSNIDGWQVVSRSGSALVQVNTLSTDARWVFMNQKKNALFLDVKIADIDGRAIKFDNPVSAWVEFGDGMFEMHLFNTASCYFQNKDESIRINGKKLASTHSGGAVMLHGGDAVQVNW